MDADLPTPKNTIDSVSSGVMFGAILAIHTDRLFLDISDHGDLMGTILAIGLISMLLFAIIHGLYVSISFMSSDTFARHRLFFLSTYYFVTSVFQWLVMLLFSAVGRWLPIAFHQSPSPTNYLFFVLLTFYAISVTYVVTSINATTKKPSIH